MTTTILFASAGLGEYIFVGAFVVILTCIAATVALASWRTRRTLKTQPVETIRWREEFHDLPDRLRDCRHAYTGEKPGRRCDQGFDCRGCEGHASLRAERSEPDGLARLAAGGEAPTVAGGLSIAADRLYHRGHTTVRPADDGTLEIGLDPFAERLVGAAEQLRLPSPGKRLRVNGTAFRVRRGDATARVLSPVEGTVVATGGPEAGWYLRVAPSTPEPDLRHLLDAREAATWLRADLERLQGLLAPTPVGATLADGGELAKDLPKALPAADWDAVWAEFFLEP
jgi:glycine cleavage system H lipoate-binding protein